MAHELRQNILTGQWVIFAPARSQRPSDFNRGAGAAHDLPEHDPNCPFCAGNDHLLPRVLFETMQGTHWQTRVVPNKFPMLEEGASSERQRQGLYVSMPGRGKHEVIVEHPRHNIHMADMQPQEMFRLIDTYYWRYISLLAEDSSMNVIIFRNYGERAGASLVHPHSQLVVTPIVPREVRLLEQRSQEYYDTWGRGLMSDIIRQELDDQRRIVAANELFVAFVPYAAEVPFEMWVVPRRQQSDFGAISDQEKHALARLLPDILGRLRTVLNDPHYNYVIRSASRYRADEPQLQWYLEIRPRLSTRAGFELGTGMRVNPALPEDNAAALRGETG